MRCNWFLTHNIFETSNNNIMRRLQENTYLFLLLVVCAFPTEIISTSIGDSCTFAKTNEPGQCVFLRNCPDALTKLNIGLMPENCGFLGKEPIICCPLETSEAGKTQRVSRKKCEEYGKSVFQIEQSLITGENTKHDTCVFNAALLPMKVKHGEFPYMARLGFDDEGKIIWLCNGVLISDQYVLINAHCTVAREYGQVAKVRLGDLDIESTEDDQNIQEFKISEIIRHPSYKPPSKYNDIALLKLEKPVQFTSFIRPACLPNIQKNKFSIVGWLLSSDSLGTLKTDSHLSHDKFAPILSHEVCNKTIQINRSLRMGINQDSQICVQKKERGCIEFSSGSVLQQPSDVYCMYDVVGILSFGYGRCLQNPDVFTRISPYIDWIETIVWP